MSLCARPISQKEPATKQRKCANKACRVKFTPDRPFVTWCSPGCGEVVAKAKIAHQNALIAKKERKEYRIAKEKQKSRRDWLGEVQAVFNAYRRESTKHFGCISCGTFNGKANGGHYRSVGSAPELRFTDENCWCQCERCNTHLSGNLINYRVRLVERIGLDRVQWLEGPHDPKHYSIDDLKAIKAEYKAKLKALET